MKPLFITATDTGVGKTRISALLLRELVARGVKAVGYKPAASGDRGDALALQQAGCDPALSLDEINPLFFQPPAAPYTAAVIEERMPDIPLLKEGFGRLRDRYGMVVVEGAGGWRVPILRDYFMSDLARDLGLPVVVVCRPNLGTLNHTLLTVESVRRDGLELAGVVMNQATADCDLISSHTNPGVLEELLGQPLLARVGFNEKEPDLSRLVDAVLRL